MSQHQGWPVAELDAVRRLRGLASARGGLYAEGRIAAPFERVWAVAGDLEGELPHYLPDVRWLRITATTGDRLEADARGRLGLRARFDGVLRPGWCVLQSRFLIGGIAAVPDGPGSRVAFLGSFRVPGLRLLRPLLAPLERRVGTLILRRLEARIHAR
jgi:hypothetical protein